MLRTVGHMAWRRLGIGGLGAEGDVASAGFGDFNLAEVSCAAGSSEVLYLIEVVTTNGT